MAGVAAPPEKKLKGEQKKPFSTAETPSYTAVVMKNKALEAELAATKAHAALNIELATAKAKLEMQPLLKESYDKGFAACKQAIADAKELMARV